MDRNSYQSIVDAAQFLASPMAKKAQPHLKPVLQTALSLLEILKTESKLAPGANITSHRIAGLMGISPTSVKDILAALQEGGIVLEVVRHKANGGYSLPNGKLIYKKPN